jgi:hypothetical protein
MEGDFLCDGNLFIHQKYIDVHNPLKDMIEEKRHQSINKKFSIEGGGGSKDGEKMKKKGLPLRKSHPHGVVLLKEPPWHAYILIQIQGTHPMCMILMTHNTTPLKLCDHRCL